MLEVYACLHIWKGKQVAHTCFPFPFRAEHLVVHLELRIVLRLIKENQHFQLQTFTTARNPFRTSILRRTVHWKRPLRASDARTSVTQRYRRWTTRVGGNAWVRLSPWHMWCHIQRGSAWRQRWSQLFLGFKSAADCRPRGRKSPATECDIHRVSEKRYQLIFCFSSLRSFSNSVYKIDLARWYCNELLLFLIRLYYCEPSMCIFWIILYYCNIFVYFILMWFCICFR